MEAPVSTMRQRLRSLRVAAYLAIIYGLAGVVSGVAGAATFIPFEHDSTYALATAGPLTVVAILGAVFSLLGVLAGYSLLRDRSWAWGASVVSAIGSVGSVGVMVVLWAPSAAFLVIVAFFYALEVVLLLLARKGVRSRPSTALPA